MRELNSMMIDDLSKLMDEYQQPRYRAKQLFKWLNSGCKPSEMTNLPKGLRSELENIRTVRHQYMKNGFPTGIQR